MPPTPPAMADKATSVATPCRGADSDTSASWFAIQQPCAASTTPRSASAAIEESTRTTNNASGIATRRESHQAEPRPHRQPTAPHEPVGQEPSARSTDIGGEEWQPAHHAKQSQREAASVLEVVRQPEREEVVGGVSQETALHKMPGSVDRGGDRKYQGYSWGEGGRWRGFSAPTDLSICH